LLPVIVKKSKPDPAGRDANNGDGAAVKGRWLTSWLRFATLATRPSARSRRAVLCSAACRIRSAAHVFPRLTAAA